MDQRTDPSSRRARRLVARGALAVAVGGAAWIVMLILFGGLDVHLAGHLLISHSPRRPMLIVGLSLAVYMLTGGDDAVVRVVAALIVMVDDAVALAGSTVCRLIIASLVLVVIGVGIVDGVKVAGGSDSYGYLSQAELWLSGRLDVPQPWAKDVPWPDPLGTFTPLGYTATSPAQFSVLGHKPRYDPWAIVPTYSPGYPMLMAGAKAVAGNPALYAVAPISGGLLVLATYGIGRRLGSARLGVVAAVLVATSSPVIEYALSPMTDVPAAAGWALAWWGALGRSRRSAWGAALALAVVILVRPDRAPLAVIIVLWLGLRILRDSAARRLHLQRVAIVVAGVAAGAASVAILFWYWYGSPLQSGYGGASAQFAWTYFLPNLGRYARTFSEVQTPLAFLGIAALFVPARRIWPGVADRVVLPFLGAFVFLVWAEFCLIPSPNAWVRFLLPSYAPIMVGVGAVAFAVTRGWRGGRLVAVAAVALLGLIGVSDASERDVFHQAGIEAEYAELGTRVRALTPENSAILAMQHSGSLRYYAGRVTLRWDQLPPDWLDRAIMWMADRGVHTYAVLDNWELVALRTQFAGQASLARFDTPILAYDHTYLFDLGLPSGATIRTERLTMAPRRTFGVAPAPAPTLVWHR